MCRFKISGKMYNNRYLYLCMYLDDLFLTFIVSVYSLRIKVNARGPVIVSLSLINRTLMTHYDSHPYNA